MKHTPALTRIELLIAIAAFVLLAVLITAGYKAIEMRGSEEKGVGNCKQIILALQQFAKEHDHHYPDSVPDKFAGGLAATSNDAFGSLIRKEIVSEESIFGCPHGFMPDGNIGTAPKYREALKPGENHWALTAGQTDTAPGSMPLVFENCRSSGWPPYWNADVTAQPHVGRTWPGGRIIIGRNDGSVAMEQLSGDHGMVSPKSLPGGLDIFVQASDMLPQRVLNIVVPPPGP